MEEYWVNVYKAGHSIIGIYHLDKIDAMLKIYSTVYGYPVYRIHVRLK